MARAPSRCPSCPAGGSTKAMSEVAAANQRRRDVLGGQYRYEPSPYILIISLCNTSQKVE